MKAFVDIDSVHNGNNKYELFSGALHNYITLILIISTLFKGF